MSFKIEKVRPINAEDTTISTETVYVGFVRSREDDEYHKMFETTISALLAKNRAIEKATEENFYKGDIYLLNDVIVKERLVTISKTYGPWKEVLVP